MKHKISKIKIKSGKDANKMLFRKLVRAFAQSGYVITTETKAKLLKSFLERIVHRCLNYNQATKNTLLPFFLTEKDTLNFVDVVKIKSHDGAKSTAIRIQKLGARVSDGVNMLRVSWAEEMQGKILGDTKKSKKDQKETIKE
jgi:ribosomal protein L17